MAAVTSKSFSIDKANAIIVVTPYDVTYDGDPHTAIGSATGVETTPADLTSLLDLSGTTRTNAGSYPAMPGPSPATATTTSPRHGGYNIDAKAASVTPNAASKTYGDTDPAFTGTLTVSSPSDGVTATYSRTSGESGRGSPYTISAVLSPAGVLATTTSPTTPPTSPSIPPP